MAPFELVVLPDPRAVAEAAAERVAGMLEGVLRRERWCWLALSGGRLMPKVYRPLAHFLVPWQRVEFFFADECCVPTEHPASAFGAAAEWLFDHPQIGSHQLHPIDGQRPDHAAAAEAYEQELPEAFDVMLLDLGVDGDVAGLFPGSPAFADGARRVHAVEAPRKPRRRITVAPDVLRGARQRVVVATGAEKAAALRRALDPDQAVEQLPGRLARESLWIVDRFAAAELGELAPAP